MEGLVSPVTITAINGKSFVSGLFWQPLSRPRTFMKEAREIGKREGMDIVAIRHSNIMQAGFVGKNEGVTKGMYSMAAVLAGALGQSWLGVFELDAARFVMVAVHDGAVLPGCDMIGTEEQVRAKLAYTYSLCEWSKIYAPASFDFGGEELDVRKLLVGAILKKEYKLRPLTFGLTRKEWVIVGGVAVAVGAALWGWSEWQQAEEKRAREALISERIRKEHELAELNKKAKKQQTVAALEHPWAKRAGVEEFVGGCMRAVNSLSMQIGGWVLTNASCDGAAISASYKRTGTATVSGFISEVKSQFDEVPVIKGDGDEVGVQRRLDAAAGGDDVLVDVDAMRVSFLSHFQAQGINPRLIVKPAAPTAPQALPGQAKGDEPVAPTWKILTFGFDTKLSPERVFRGAPSAGVRLSNIEVKADEQASSLTWTLKGDVYAK